MIRTLSAKTFGNCERLAKFKVIVAGWLKRKMVKNNYVRLFVISGLPITVFFAVFFSLLLGIHEGLIPGLLIGFLIGSLISLVLGYFYSNPVKELMLDSPISFPRVQKNTMIILTPYIILFLGAIVTRFTGKTTSSFAVTIILSLGVCVLLPYFSEELRRSLLQAGHVSYIAYIATKLIPFTIMYFIFLVVVYGFNFEKVIKLLRQ